MAIITTRLINAARVWGLTQILLQFWYLLYFLWKMFALEPSQCHRSNGPNLYQFHLGLQDPEIFEHDINSCFSSTERGRRGREGLSGRGWQGERVGEGERVRIDKLETFIHYFSFQFSASWSTLVPEISTTERCISQRASVLLISIYLLVVFIY